MKSYVLDVARKMPAAQIRKIFRDHEHAIRALLKPAIADKRILDRVISEGKSSFWSTLLKKQEIAAILDLACQETAAKE